MGRTSDAKERLLKAATDLIWERSYGVVTIDGICEKAKVKKGSFYYFFDSKAALAIASLESEWDGIHKPKWDTLFSASTPPLERLRKLFQFVHDHQAELQKNHGCVLGCPCFSLGSETCTQDENLRLKVQEVLQLQVRYFESAIRDAQAEGSIPAGDASLKAKSLFAFFEGSLAQARIHNDLAYIRNLPETALQFLGAKQGTSVV